MTLVITINFDEEGKVIDYKIEQSDGIKESITPSRHAKWFDKNSVKWSKNAEFNLMFLERQQEYANDILRSRGHLFLNEVYDMLDIPRTSAGQQIGWIYNEDKFKDVFVDFGIYKPYNSDFVNGISDKALLDFNVDINVCNYLED